MVKFQYEQELRESHTINEYRETTKRVVWMLYPNISNQELDIALDYSISKRFKNSPASVYNNYKNHEVDMNLLALTEYIYKREPVLTNYGVMFKKRGTAPNPLVDVTIQFMENRNIHKKQMFQFPKGSDDYATFNLLQQLDKIDANGQI